MLTESYQKLLTDQYDNDTLIPNDNKGGSMMDGIDSYFEHKFKETR